MNFSEYTLVSFGDSFTFGQDTIEGPTRLSGGQQQWSSPPEQWKNDCNSNSYTQFIADRMGFKDNLNFGVMSGSNERSLTLLENFLRNNPEKKIFVLFNFTHSSRFLQYFKIEGKPRYASENIHVEIWNSQESLKEGRYTGITKRGLNNHYTYWRNSIQDVYNHVKDRRMLYYMLSTYNVPYVTFDIMNDTDNRMLRDNPIDYIENYDEGFGVDFMYNDDESYVFKEMDFLKLYRQELVDKSPLLCHMGIDELGGLANLRKYLNSKAKLEYGDENYYTEQRWPGSHWNIEGHHEVAKLIGNFIKKKYEN